MDAFLQDLRFGVRTLLSNRGFAIVTILTLALGIGANTALFSTINAVLLRPLAYADADRLVMVWEDASFAGFPRNTPAPANYVDWKSQSQSFEDMAATATTDFSLTGDGEPEKVDAYRVTANFFPLLGVRAALGRTFSADEDRPGSDKVVVLGHALWESRYGGDPTVIGRDILLDGEKRTVVGVMPARFQFREADVGLWVPMAFDAEALSNRGGHYLIVVARLKDGVTAKAAESDVQTIMGRIARDYPDDAEGVGAVVVPLREDLAGDVERPLVLLLVAVGLVLLIACANVANLLLSRAVARRKEIAVRAALGASRVRMARQLLTESLLLSGLGALAGLFLAYASFAFLEKLVPNAMRLSTSLALDWRALGFTVALALLTGVAFGLAPALLASKVDLNDAIKQGGGRANTGTGSGRLRSMLVVSQVGLAVVLLVGAGLLIRTLVQLQSQYSGLRATQLLTLRTALSEQRYDAQAKRTAFYDEVLERVRTTPGVRAAGYTTTVPLEWKGGSSGFVPEGMEVRRSLSYDANHRQVSADYLATIGIPLREGRYFSATDGPTSMPVAIVNETMARQYWPGTDAVGKRFKVDSPEDPTRPWLTIVGVVDDIRQMGADAPVKAEMYLPYSQTGYDQFFAPRDLVLRTDGDPNDLVAAVRNEIRAVDPDQPVSNVRTMDDVLGEETSNRRTGMVLLSTFAVLALLLASLGLYGLLAYSVAQRTPEIGVRLALGARPRDILAMILRKGMGLVVAGTTVGLVAAFALARLISSMLFGVAAADPLTFATVPAVLIVVATLACLVPARRAARVDPNVALKAE